MRTRLELGLLQSVDSQLWRGSLFHVLKCHEGCLIFVDLVLNIREFVAGCAL